MELKGKINLFYEQEIEFLFPENFDLFIQKINEIIGLKKEELFTKISLYYKDNEEDEVLLLDKSDYGIFIIYVIENNKNNKNLITLFFELKEDLKEKIYQKMNIYKKNNNKEKKISININEFEINNEIKDKIANENENKINEYENLEKNNIVKTNYENINEINKINNKYYYNESNIESQNQFNNNLNNNDNYIFNTFKENTKNINLTKNYKYTYQESCSICKDYPLNDIFYYCNKCKLIYCSNCESKDGSSHIHPLYKIQTKNQYNNSDINKKDENLGEKIGAFGSKLVGVFGEVTNMLLNKNKNQKKENDAKENKNDDMNNDENKKGEDKNDYKKLIEELKSTYELINIDDENIEEAIKLADGDKDKALEFLFK